MIETTARIRLPGPSVLLVMLNFVVAIVGVVLTVLGMSGVETHVRIETPLISKGPLVGLCIFIVIIDLMFMFTKFHLGKNIDKPLTFFLVVLKYASAIFLVLAILNVNNLKSVIATTEEAVCKHGTEFATYFFHSHDVSLRQLGLDIYLGGPKGIDYWCGNMKKTLPSISLAMVGIGFALFAQINFMMITTFGYRQFKKDDIVVATKPKSSKVKMVTKSDRLNERNSREKRTKRSRSASRKKSTRGTDVSRMSRSQRTNHRRNHSRFSESSFGNRGGDLQLDMSVSNNFSKVGDATSLDDVSLSDIERYV